MRRTLSKWARSIRKRFPKPYTLNASLILDRDSQRAVGAIPSMAAGGAGHETLLNTYFDLLEEMRPEVFCDIGANKGEAGQRAKKILPNAKVFGFEANPHIHSRYADMNVKAGVHWLNLAVANETGTVNLHVPKVLSRALRDNTLVDELVIEAEDTGKSSLLLRDEEAKYETISVPSVTLDRFLDSHAPDGRVALWIDVEGAASVVLDGAMKTLSRTDAIILEVEGFRFWKDQALVSHILETLAAQGFRAVARDREYEDAQFNIICVRANAQLDHHQRHIAINIDKSRLSTAQNSSSRNRVSVASTPIFVPCFNNPTYAQSMMEQLQALGFQDVTFVDNASDSKVMHDGFTTPKHAGYRSRDFSRVLAPALFFRLKGWKNFHDGFVLPTRI